MGGLDGLAERWDEDASIRSIVLHRGTLLQWPSPQLVGVHTFVTMAINERVLMEVLKIWVPKTSTPKTINIDDARDQDRCPKTSYCFKACFKKIRFPVSCLYFLEKPWEPLTGQGTSSKASNGTR